MSDTPLRTVLIGFGKEAAGHARDPRMALHYPFSTHAQVLRSHPGFSWEAVVDLSARAREEACREWGVAHAAASPAEAAHLGPEVAVLATPPGERLALLEELPTLRAVLVERPLGRTAREAREFLEGCRRRGLLVQVNLWRRADEGLRALAAGGLDELVGAVQAAFAVYGNGLRRNGTHLVDLARMLLGEIRAVQAVPRGEPRPAGPLPGDVQLPFTLRLESGAAVMFQPLEFERYRENGLDLWGERGRLSILQEGLSILHFPLRENRAMEGVKEVASDAPRPLLSTVGHAFRRMYDNLADTLHRGAPLWSPGESALRSEEVVEKVLVSADEGGSWVELEV